MCEWTVVLLSGGEWSVCGVVCVSGVECLMWSGLELCCVVEWSGGVRC